MFSEAFYGLREEARPKEPAQRKVDKTPECHIFNFVLFAAPEKCRSVPEDYMKRVKEMHEHGGGGSLG